MSDVFIVYLFYFQINKHITILLHRIKHLYKYARIYQIHDIEYSVFYIYKQNCTPVTCYVYNGSRHIVVSVRHSGTTLVCDTSTLS